MWRARPWPSRSKGKTVEEVREYYDIEDGFMAEEKEKIMAENSWAFE